MFDRIADGIETSVSDSGDLEIVIIVMDRCFSNDTVLLFEMAFVHCKYRFCIDIIVLENAVYQIRSKLFVSLVGYVFDKISHFFAHLLRQADSEALLQDIIYAAFS